MVYMDFSFLFLEFRTIAMVITRHGRFYCHGSFYLFAKVSGECGGNWKFGKLIHSKMSPKSFITLHKFFSNSLNLSSFCIDQSKNFPGYKDTDVRTHNRY